MDIEKLEKLIGLRLSRLSAAPLPPLARDEDPADIIIDSCHWLEEKKGEPFSSLHMACQNLANLWSLDTEGVRLHPEPLGELHYLCARIGAAGAIAAIARVVLRNDLRGILLPGGEELQLRALRSLSGLLLRAPEERNACRKLFEKALDTPQHLPTGLTALVAFWPSEKDRILHLLKTREVPDIDRLEEQIERNVRLMIGPLGVLARKEQGGSEGQAMATANVRTKKAQDLMHKGVETISGSATVAEALKKMRGKKVSSLIVERRNAQDAWGIITKKDIVTKVIDPGPTRRNLSTTKVHEVMSKPLVTVSPGLAIKYCVRLMRAAGVTRAPVFDGKEILGILSFTDVLNHA